MKIFFEKCNNLFIDFDGVVVDSNKFKECAIEKAILKWNSDSRETFEAIEYFNINAGLSRKKKLSLFFGDVCVSNIMETYAQDCYDFFLEAKPTKGIKEFLEFIRKKNPNIKIFILSGGEEKEIKSFLENNFLIHFFEGILASEKTKVEHIEGMGVSDNDIFIGDSKNDLKTSLKTGLNFILFEEYKSKKSYPKESLISEILFKTKNFETLLSIIDL